MKDAFINRLTDRGYTKTEAAAIAEAFVEEVAHALESHGTAKLPRLGKLVLRDTTARIGRNPATGEPIKIPEKTSIRFRPSKALHERVQGGPFPF